jgi:hypothetical protein
MEAILYNQMTKAYSPQLSEGGQRSGQTGTRRIDMKRIKCRRRPLVVGVAGIMGAGKSTAGVFEILGPARRCGCTATMLEPAMRDAIVGDGSGVRDRDGAIDTAARRSGLRQPKPRKLDESRDPRCEIKAR